MKTTKKLTAIIMCIAMILTAIPMAAFAQEPDETLEPYIKIVFKNYEDKDILPNESVELYLDYEKGNNDKCKFDWFVEGAGTGYQYESASPWEGRPGIKVTPTTHGTITVIARMFNVEKELVARDEIEITVIDERNIFEKTFEGIADFFKYSIAGLSMIGIASLFLGLGIFSGIIETPAALFDKIFKF